MNKIKVLNLYAGIGGNRKLWENVDVTAIENNKEIAAIYKDFFPKDKVIVTDAHEYLLEHFQEFEFIWSSPPCPSHSRIRMLWSGNGKNIKNKISGSSFKFPNMQLYEEIIFLKHFFKGLWVVENVISYYEPLIKSYESEKHYFWSNFNISKRKAIVRDIRRNTSRNLSKYGFNLNALDLPRRFKVKLINNLVNPYLGLHIWNCAFKTRQTRLEL